MTIKTLNLSFDFRIRFEEISKFRGAMVELMGRDDDWLHNHNNQSGGLHYRYPKIQYRRQRGKAHIFALEEAIPSVQEMLMKLDETIYIGNREQELVVDELSVNRHLLQLTAEPQTYRIYQWMPLNQKNYSAWRQANGLVERYQMLEKLLVNHIIGFAKDLQWKWGEERIVVVIKKIMKHPIVTRRHQTKLMTFDLEFSCNVSLPNGLALGKAVSHGHGVLKKMVL